MNNLTEDKQKALRIYGAICEDFDSEHYSSCVNLIKKNREFLASFLSPTQDEKLYKIYAYSIFTLIEDNYLAGNEVAANSLLKSYESLLDNHLPHDVKKALEGYKTGEIPEVGSETAKENLKFDPSTIKEEFEKDKTSWTITDNSFEEIIKNSEKKSSKPAKLEKPSKGGKTGAIVAIILALAVAIGIFFGDPLLKFIKEQTNTAPISTTPIEQGGNPIKPDDELQIMEPATPPPIEEPSTVDLPNNPDSLISPDVKVNSDGYILPTDSKVITEEDLKNFDQKMIRLTTNEMFARKGFAFNSTGEYYQYFCQFSWYEPNPDMTIDQAESMFSETEKANLVTLLNFTT